MHRGRLLLSSVVALLVTALVGPAPRTARAQDDAGSRRAAIDAMYPVMLLALEEKNFGRARNLCDQAIIWEPQNPVHHYNLACIEAQTGPNRLPQAMGELQLAIALGFNDPVHLQNDPDLAPLHDDPKFAELVRKVALDSTVGSTAPTQAPTPSTPAPATTPSPSAPGATGTLLVVNPAPATVQNGVPIGLYFMSRYWSFSNRVEKAAWYFAPDGQVYQNVELGFSAADLAVHPGPRGIVRTSENKLEVLWSDGKKSSSEFDQDGTGFNWDLGIFIAAPLYHHEGELAGIYSHGESLAGAGGRRPVATQLELKADGTFAWNGPSFSTSAKDCTGQWKLREYTLILTESGGAVLRGIVFPETVEKNPLKPARMFFGGVLYQRAP